MTDVCESVLATFGHFPVFDSFGSFRHFLPNLVILALFGTFLPNLVTLYGGFFSNLVALFGHISFTVHGSTSLNSFLTVLIRKNIFWLILALFDTFWPIFFAHFDPWTISDKSLQ